MDPLVLLIAPLAALLWGVTNFIDKYLVGKVAKRNDYRGLVVVSSLVAGLILTPISLVLTRGQIAADFAGIAIVFLAAVSYVVATIFYFKALSRNDTSLVVTAFNLIPVFGYVLGLIFLDEQLDLHQILGGSIIIIASAAIFFEFDKSRFSRNKLLGLMALASLSYAVYFLLFRIATIEHDFNVMAFWYQIGLAVTGVLLCAGSRRYRKSFVDLIAKNGKIALGLNLINEAANLSANLFVNFAMTLAPMAVVQSLNGFQPIFVFLLGLLLSVCLPKLFKEDRRRHVLAQRLMCILLSFAGLAILCL